MPWDDVSAIVVVHDVQTHDHLRYPRREGRHRCGYPLVHGGGESRRTCLQACPARMKGHVAEKLAEGRRKFVFVCGEGAFWGTLPVSRAVYNITAPHLPLLEILQ